MAEWWNGRMAEWQTDGIAEWRNGRMAEWQNGGIAEWQNGGVVEWRNGGIAEWHSVRYEIVRNQDTESTQMPPWRSPSRLVAVLRKKVGKPNGRNQTPIWIPHELI